jgi:poly-beta-1,6-N-acetyl-D-glucosamine synthase
MTGLRIAIVVPFLDEEAHLPRMLASLEAQSRRPDRLLLVDDGSRDGSTAAAEAFAARHAWATVLRRPRRPHERDRLARGSAVEAFAWGVAELREPWGAVAKLDADVQLSPRTVETVERCLLSRPAVGISGGRLGVDPAGGAGRHRARRDHVDGAIKFYRRACWEDIAPLPVLLGWDTIDEVRARLQGWAVASVDVPGGNPVQLRAMGLHDGLLRGYRRWGRCAWGYGEHPLHVLAVALQRLGDRPPVIGSANYILGWVLAALRRSPRAEPAVRRYVREDQLRRLRRRARAFGRPALAGEDA